MKLGIVLCSILLTSCHPLFCTWDWGYNQLTKEPNRKEVVGRYELITSSKTFLRDKDFKIETSKLELTDNGQFEIINAPDLIFDNQGKSKQKLVIKSGKWSLGCGDSYGCVIEIENIGVIPMAEKDGRLAILISIGDGDECNGVVYERVD